MDFLTPLAWLWTVLFYITAIVSAVLAIGALLDAIRSFYLWGFLSAPLTASVAIVLHVYALQHPVQLW